MKKRKIFIFSIVCFFCLLLNVRAAIRCDIDSDGEVTNNDKKLLDQIIIDGIDSSDSRYYAADCNGDGIVNISDLVAMKKNIGNIESKNSCGSIEYIPQEIPELTSLVVTLIQIAVPIVLVIMGMLDLFKGIMAQKEDEIKKGQQIFIKRLIAGALVFFVVIIVKFIISFVANENSTGIIECMECFINNDCN